MTGDAIRRSILDGLAFACLGGVLAPPVAAQIAESSGLEFPPDESYLQYPVDPKDRAYLAIDGLRMKGYVAEQTAIARRYRDAGHQYWGRIIGTEADHETAAWMAEKLREAGAENVRIEWLDLPPEWMPQSWEVVASRAGESSVSLQSAWPAAGSPGTPPGGLDVEMVDVSLGMETDFQGRDVRGKAVIIHSIARPGSIQNSAARDGSIARADQRGAAAVFVIIELPGNLQMSLYPTATSGPLFALGAEDGATLQKMLAEADMTQSPPRLRLCAST